MMMEPWILPPRRSDPPLQEGGTFKSEDKFDHPDKLVMMKMLDEDVFCFFLTGASGPDWVSLN